MNIIVPKKLDESFKLGIVVSRFNSVITEALLEGALQRLQELNFPRKQTTVVWVPGAIEIGLVAQQLARTGIYKALICLGAVIQGETDHYQYVCRQVSDSCQKVALDNHIPVIFGVLTTTNEEQAQERVGGRHGHAGRSAVDSAMDMVSILQQLSKLQAQRV